VRRATNFARLAPFDTAFAAPFDKPFVKLRKLSGLRYSLLRMLFEFIG
jgi:hypothetical protein